jgi:hypothetical protein
MIRVVLAAACAVALAGCATGKIDTRYPFPTEAASPVSKAGGAPLRQMQVDLGALLVSRLTKDGGVVPSTVPSPITTQSQLDQAIAAVRDAGHPKQVRNDVVASWVAASTANCGVYVQALRSGQVTTRLATDFFSGGLAAASSLAAPVRTAKLLSALSAFSTAEGASVDRNIFAQQGAELVADAILQMRAEDRTKIEASMARSYDEWPMGLAMADLFDFHKDCSMLRGFTRMRVALEQREQDVAATRASGAPLLVTTGWNHDLLKLQADAARCLADATEKLSAKPADLVTITAAEFGTAGACQSSPNNWANGFNVAAVGALPTAAALTGPGVTPAQVKAALDAAEQANDKAAADLLKTRGDARVAALSQVSKVSMGDASQVVKILTDAGAAAADPDPVLAQALKAAKAIATNDPGKGSQAAKAAIAAANEAAG